jgi:putative ABC transport system permease protein
MKHEREFFATIAVDSDTYFDVFDDLLVPPEQKEAWLHDPQGALVGEVLAKKLGWKVGDKVMLVSGIYADKPEWEFHIKGLYGAKRKGADRSTFFFHWEYMNKNINARAQDQIGWMVSRIDEAGRTADVGLGLDKVFEERETQTRSQDEHAFATSFLAGASAVLTALDVISDVILAIMMLILGNTIAMGARERTNEYGVLKALGFSNGMVGAFVVGEAMMIAALGGLLGLGLAYPFIQNGLGPWLEDNMGTLFRHFRIDGRVTAMAVVLPLVLGAAASVIPAVTAARLRVVDALRRVA